MNIVQILEKNGIPHTLSGGQVITPCPFCKIEHLGDALGTFHIDQSTGRGECVKCHKIAEFEVWLEAFGIGIRDEKEESKSHKKQSFKKLADEGNVIQEPDIPIERVRKVEKPSKEVSFEEWRRIIKENFPDFVFPAEVAISVVAQILITEITNPFALVLVDVPSSGKTITINFFDGIEGISYATDKFTPASFVSNASNVKKEALPEVDLLPRIRYKVLLIRDLATLFSKNEDSLNEALGLLTRVLDGEGLSTDSGVHGQRQYSGDYLFMMLAASTPIQPRVWKVMGSIGSRLFFLNMRSREKTEAELVEQITTLSPKEKEGVCKEATRNFLHTLWHKHSDGIVWDKSKDESELMLIIARCAKLLAKLRGVIHVYEKKSQSGEVSYEYRPPVIENPDRIIQLFYNLCRGHAVVCGRKQISSDNLSLIIELAIDGAPTARAKLFRGLLVNNGLMKTSDVKKCLFCSAPTAHKEMETLEILGIASVTAESDGSVGEPEKRIKLRDEFKWFLSDECRALRGVPPLPPTYSKNMTDTDTGMF